MGAVGGRGIVWDGRIREPALSEAEGSSQAQRSAAAPQSPQNSLAADDPNHSPIARQRKTGN